MWWLLRIPRERVRDIKRVCHRSRTVVTVRCLTGLVWPSSRSFVRSSASWPPAPECYTDSCSAVPNSKRLSPHRFSAAFIMTRFRAYATDSEDEYPSSDDSTSSDRRIPVAGPSTRSATTRVPQPLRDSEDSDMYTEPEQDEEDNSSVSSASPPPNAARLADPTLIPWARDIGVDPQKMHVMQATLFRLPEEAAAMQEVSRQQEPRRRLIPPATIGRKHSRDSEGEGLRADSRQVCNLNSFYCSLT